MGGAMDRIEQGARNPHHMSRGLTRIQGGLTRQSGGCLMR